MTYKIVLSRVRIPYNPEFFSGFLFAPENVASINAMIYFQIIVHPAVHIYDFHLFITSYKIVFDICGLHVRAPIILVTLYYSYPTEKLKKPVVPIVKRPRFLAAFDKGTFKKVPRWKRQEKRYDQSKLF